MPLLERLRQCSQQPQSAFHTPGHKRGQGISAALRDCLGSTLFPADLPELPELDNLFAPQGVIKVAQDLAAATFGAEQTWFLANGSTAGVIASILATCNPGEKIILPRNVHYSAISGLILAGAIPVFIQPEYDAQLDIAHSVTVESVATALATHPDARAVMLVYPTYYGVCGDVAAIAHLCHQHHKPLLVDEAHGAHFACHPDLPPPALTAGADVAVQSTHKTLSALTQAAMLHVKGDRIDRQRLARSLALVQSTSPSYLLLASLDAARQQVATVGRHQWEQALQLADWAQQRIHAIPGLSTLGSVLCGTPGFVALDRTRLTVTVSALGIDGFRADDYLREQFDVVAELPSLHNLTFIVTPGNTVADMERMVAAFQSLAQVQGDVTDRQPSTVPVALPALAATPLSDPRAAFFAPRETISLTNAIARVSAEMVCPYPPGIPVLLPGEVITAGAIAMLQQILAAGGTVSGCADPGLETLQVVKL